MSWNLHVVVMLAVVLATCVISETLVAGSKPARVLSVERAGR